MTLQMKTHNNSVSDTIMDSEKVERLSFPLLFPHGEPGYTNSSNLAANFDIFDVAKS